jgi:hypothetical protein
MSLPAQTSHLMPSGLITPAGTYAALASGTDLVIADLNRDDPDLHVPLDLARPWRAAALKGDIYRTRRVADPRSTNRTTV